MQKLQVKNESRCLIKKKPDHFTQNLILILEYVIPSENYHGKEWSYQCLSFL
jgi:hypothetical protein